MQYSVLSSPCERTYEMKKSKFIAYAQHASDRGQALKVLADVKLRYPDARHHCWAYLIGQPQSPNTMAMSDDGEPSGTAGKPILNVLQHGDIGNLIVVVSRYFGGIKLGAGGLVRAYSNATQQLLDNATTNFYEPVICIQIESDYHQEQYSRHLLQLANAEVSNVNYTEHVTLRATIPQSQIEALKEQLHAHQISITVL